MGLFGKKTNTAANVGATTQQQDSTQLNEIVLRYIREGVVIISSKGNIKLINPAAERMFGRPLDESIGLNYESTIKLLDADGNAVSDQHNPIGYALQSGEYGETRDFRLVTLDSNKATPVSVIVTPTGEKGSDSDLIVTFRDIERELRQEQERNDFISTASHEMRTPVASIEGYLGLAMNPATATVDQRGMEYLTKAHEAAQHLGRLFQELLDTTKLDDGKLNPRFEPVELVELVKRIAAGQVPNITAKGLGYQFGSGNVDQSLGGGKHIDQVIYASVDKDFLNEVVDNLLENAIKYTPSGWVTVTVKADKDNVQIIVEDTGIGIPKEELSHVFQKFYRVDNRDTREIGGTGLGLYLTKQRVEAMNGRIWAESEVGKGTRFIVALPRLSADIYERQMMALRNSQMMEMRPNL